MIVGNMPSFRRSTLVLSSLLLVSCASNSRQARMGIAENIAFDGNLLHSQIDTSDFTFTVYEKITKKSASVSIYIEGDGLAWLSRRTPSRNPTPTNPVGLKLAAHDNHSENIIYIARPCQYTAMTKSKPCSSEYWTSKRFAPEVVESVNQAIDKLKQQHQFSDINLIGYSGGAAISTLLAARRDDVRSLRTVAGNIDIDAFSDLHNVSKMYLSLNPASVAYKIKDLPQIHFIGKKDKVVPYSIFKSYDNKSGVSGCMDYKIVPDVNHQEGWGAVWLELMNIPFSCL